MTMKERCAEIAEKYLNIEATEIMTGEFTVDERALADQVMAVTANRISNDIAALPDDDWRDIETFQDRVAKWMLDCFTPEIAADKLERNDRFIEEALELVQSLNYSADRAHELVEYVFNRPKGEPSQEVGGVMITLAALCGPNDLNINQAAETEYERINRPEVIDKIRAKQATKPTGSALPAPLPTKAERPSQ